MLIYSLNNQKGAHSMMKKMQIAKAFTLMESGPVVFITTNDGEKSNIMTISWTMVMDFTPIFAITTGPGTAVDTSVARVW